jgi:membrane associated rhomboid family serine protease
MTEPAGTDAEEQPQSRREPLLNLPAVIVAIILLCAAIHLLRSFALSEDQDFELLLRAAFFPVRYSGGYDLDLYAFTSPVTYSLLHGGLAHLAINMVWLAAFGSPLANRIGPLRFIAFWIFTALGAAALHYIARPEDLAPVVGASGAISGMMGAAARFGFRIDRSDRRPIFAGRRLTLLQSVTNRQVVIFLSVWLLINLVAGLGFDFTGSGGQIAWEAHIGGMLAGLLGIALFDRASPSAALGD